MTRAKSLYKGQNSSIVGVGRAVGRSPCWSNGILCHFRTQKSRSGRMFEANLAHIASKTLSLPLKKGVPRNAMRRALEVKQRKPVKSSMTYL